MAHLVLECPHYSQQTTDIGRKHVEPVCSNLPQIPHTNTTDSYCVHFHSRGVQDPRWTYHVITWYTGSNKDEDSSPATRGFASEEVPLDKHQGSGRRPCSSTQKSQPLQLLVDLRSTVRSTETEDQSLSWGKKSKTYSCLRALDVKSSDCFFHVFDNALKSSGAGSTGTIDEEAKVNAGSANWWLSEISKNLAWSKFLSHHWLYNGRQTQTDRQTQTGRDKDDKKTDRPTDRLTDRLPTDSLDENQPTNR